MADRWKRVAPGIRTRVHPTRKHGLKPDMYFVLRFTVEGQRKQEALGWASEGVTLAKAQAELHRLKEAARTGEGPVTLQERRARARASREAESNKPTIRMLWDFYQHAHAGRPNSKTDASNAKHLTAFMDELVEHIRTSHVDALRRQLEAKGKAPQTVKHVLGLLRRIIRYGAQRGLCAMPSLDRLHFDMPQLDNLKTECLTPEEAKSLLDALDADENQNLAALVRLALATGMRRGALFGLQWADLDFRNMTITLRGSEAKSGRTETIPMTESALAILSGVERHTASPYVFPGKDGGKRTTAHRFLERIRKRANLPDGFRPLHGLRHTFASWLASSGQVDLYTLQRLLTHGSHRMTERYAHLADATTRRAAAIIDGCWQEAVNAAPSSAKNQKIIPFGGRCPGNGDA